MKNKSNKKVSLESVAESIDNLAVITKRGFDNVHDELKEFKGEMHDFRNKTDATLFTLSSKANQTNDRLEVIEKTLGPLVHVFSVVQKEIRSLNTRVDRLEKIISHK